MSGPSINDLPMPIREQIDAQCDAFERAWSRGESPILGDFLERVDPQGRQAAVRELLIIERNYHRGPDGSPVSDHTLVRRHTGRVPDVADELRMLQASEGLAGEAMPTGNPTEALPASAAKSRSGSRGLHIRCPHCSNAVELVVDTPYDSVTCSACGSAFSLVDREQETREASALKRIGRFELISRLGIGGFGTVWKARDTELDRTVAVKLPRKGQLDATELEQFYREARSAAQLRHPNIVPVHEVGREHDMIFIVSDLVRGIPLSDWLSGANQGMRESARLVVTIAEALHHAHAQGVIHRDLKPSNILIDEDGQPHLMDFGLAKREVGEITMTVDGQVLGTPAYMSPEQARGKGHWTDRRTDIYSLGVILFRMLTGELPFRGNAQMQIHQRLTDDAPNPRRLNRHIPRDLATICLKCLERDPNGRYSTAAALAADLQRFLKSEPIEARPISRVERLLRWSKRRPGSAVATVLTLVLAIFGPLAAMRIERQRQRLEDVGREKDNVIGQYAVAQQRAVESITRLEKELDLWEGRADPWQYWPPKSDDKPRELMLAKLAENRVDVLQQNLQSGKYAGEEEVLAQLSLAILRDETTKVDAAMRHYEAASKKLAELIDARPQEPQFQLALADCWIQLARLSFAEQDNVEVRSRKAKGLLKKATILLERLADDTTTPRVIVQQLETELRSTLADGFGRGRTAEHLATVAKLQTDLEKALPHDPAGLYRLICFLAQRDAVLLDHLDENTGDLTVTAPDQSQIGGQIPP